jgi:CxxC-x17-CxxC domain-containing protein
MKKPLKNEIDLLSLINNIKTQLIELDKKVNTLIFRSLPETKIDPKPTINNTPPPIRPIDNNRGRVMHTAICADCKKECTIPFKPSGDRPVYCKDCFSRRKVISMSGIKVDDKPQINIQEQKVKVKKKPVAVKKSVAKKKPTPKKK